MAPIGSAPPAGEPGSIGAGVTIGADILSELFSRDIKAAAIACTKLLSCYNAVLYAPNFLLPADLADMAPAYPHSFKLAVGTSFLRRLSPATRSGLKGFTFYLGRARDEVFRLTETYGTTRAVHQGDVETAREVTSSAACFAKLAASDVLALARRKEQLFEVAQLSYFSGLLDDVLDGKCPLWGQGRVLEVRSDFVLRERRVAITAIAILVGNVHEEPVIVTNVSRGGLGFNGGALFAAGQGVVIRMTDPERTFKGQIMWQQGHKAGMRFHEALADDDDLLWSVLTNGNATQSS